MAVRSLLGMRSDVVRTCVGCRERADKSDLLRLVAAGNEVVPDPRARLAGRGAYLHPSQGCFELAQRRRAFPRVLRAPGALGVALLAEYLASRTQGDSPGHAGEMMRTDGNVSAKAGLDGDERAMSSNQ
ncbi:MAG TPA: YlxR family protein [Streptosporangiaceae bacterium]